jgi:hypothetical protein
VADANHGWRRRESGILQHWRGRPAAWPPQEPHDTFHFVIVGAVREYPPDEKRACCGFNLPVDGVMIFEHRTRITRQRVVSRKRLQIGQRAANVTWDEVEEGCRRGREEADIEMGVQKQGRHVSAVENIL